MFTLRDRATGDLFDRWSGMGAKRRALLDRFWAGIFRQHLLAELPVNGLLDGFDDGFGRPSKDIHVAMGVLVLQQMNDLTDAATVEALAFNLAWHFALDVQSEADCYFCEKTLRNYRRQVIDRELDEVLFRHLTDQLVAAFDVDPSRQRMDSTALRSAMRSLTRLGIIVETISKFVRTLERKHPGLYSQINASIIQRYVDRDGEGCFSNTMPSISKRRLAETGPDLLNLKVRFCETKAAALPEYALLERVLQEQFAISEDDCDDGRDNREPMVAPRSPKDIPCDAVSNPADPDASYNAHKGLGYVAQIVETYCEDDGPEISGTGHSPDLITHVAVHKMTVHDGHRLPDALDDLATRNLMPNQLLGDTHYGGPENIALAGLSGVTLMAPTCAPKGKGQGRLTLEDFTLYDDGCVKNCPCGIAPVATSRSNAKVQASFELKLCRACPDILRCPVNAATKQGEIGRFQYHPTRIASRERRLYEATKKFRDIYRWRAGIEATMARLKHQMNLDKLRIRGMTAMRYVTNMRALGLNIFRCAATQRLKSPEIT